MATASWKNTVIAESSDVIEVEGNLYFPADSVDRTYLHDSPKTTRCPWKGTASYYDVVVDGDVNSAAAWYYANPKKQASRIRDRVAFWRGVVVED